MEEVKEIDNDLIKDTTTTPFVQKEVWGGECLLPAVTIEHRARKRVSQS